MKTTSFLFIAIVFTMQFASTETVEVGEFPQEVAQTYTTSNGLPSNQINCIAVTDDGVVYAGTDKGIAVFKNEKWSTLTTLNIMMEGDAIVHAIDIRENRVVAAVRNKLFVFPVKDAGRFLPDMSLETEDFSGIALAPTDQFSPTVVLSANYSGLYQHVNVTRRSENQKSNVISQAYVYSLAINDLGRIAFGAADGLYMRTKTDKHAQLLFPSDSQGRSWAPRDVRAVDFDRDGNLWFASPQGIGKWDGESWTLFEGKDGLPYNDFTCMDASNDDVWFGTQKGAIFYDGDEFHYRQGLRWLPDDEVNGVAVDQDGNAWFATKAGVGVIRRVPMTLAQKAAYYENEVEQYIKRTEYGYLSEVHLAKPGDRSEIIYSDSDNDGLWTSMYGAGECYAFAATKDPDAKRRAQESFEALRFLSVAPDQGVIEQQPGYVARTVLPTTEPDPNKRHGHTIEGQQEHRDNQDALWKVYTPRWVKTKDGKYWYKTDTSSDELDGHYFFYPLYYDLVADTEAEKERVREVVRNLTDHLLRNNFRLIDHDGAPARWSDYSPEALNTEHYWYNERGLKSLSMLTYLAVAEHITGDETYGAAARELMEKHNYDTNAMVTKIQFGVGSGNQSDDEMAVMCYYNLIKYTNDPVLREEMAYSFYKYWILEQPEMNPFFNFAFAASAARNPHYKNPWGEYTLKPWDGWLEDSVATLTGFPLDRVNWPLQNSHRLDIARLMRQAEVDPYDEPGRDRGLRVNGKVLPIENRHFNHWNTDPYSLNYGGNGRTLASGAVYLLPYYMGLYYEYIQ
ncbi:MAG: hypothetical protein P9L94_11135 [Candidatus Hinthialibacter antarcticus]|nr:hypothetical protein [Candidatus Hinthialibacter antarcticus]